MTTRDRWLDPLTVVPRSGPAAAVARRLRRGTVCAPAPVRMTARLRGDLAELALGEPIAARDDVRAYLDEQSALVWRRARLVSMTNNALPLPLRIRAASGSNLYWQLRLAVSEPDVPDDVVAGWVTAARSDALLSQVHDLLELRPGLLPVFLDAGPRVAFAASGSLRLRDVDAEQLLRVYTARTAAGRVALSELAVNPVLGRDVRREALARVTRHWSAPARAAATAVAGIVVPADAGDVRAATVSADQLVGLLVWASGSAVLLDDAHQRSRRAKPVTWERLSCHPVATVLLAQTPLLTAPPPGLSSGLPVATPDTPLLPAQVTSAPLPDLAPQTLLAAHLVWDLPMDVPTSRRWWYYSTLRTAAAADVAAACLGDDAAAWETFAALAGEWVGTFGQLLAAAGRLSGERP